MNSAPHLLPEDRPEFERAVDEALREASRRPALAAAGEQISAEQLRVMALSAATAIAADAAEEYEEYVALRTRLRQPAGHGSGNGGSASGLRGGDGEQPGGAGGLSLAGVGEGVGETTGAGLLAMVSVLVPLLAGTAAVIFLLIGNLLRVVSPEPSIAAPMRGAGWVFAVLAAAGIVVAMAELWFTAVRNGAGARRSSAAEASGTGMGSDAGAEGESRLAREVSAARTVWREALLERGIVPFLERALGGQPGGADGGPGSASASGTAFTSKSPSASASASEAETETEAESPGARTQQTPRREERTPRLGYSGPDFSSRSPSDGKERGSENGRKHGSMRPRYSSPDYSSPDYGGPEHKPD